jgi:hypothetical protein
VNLGPNWALTGRVGLGKVEWGPPASEPGGVGLLPTLSIGEETRLNFYALFDQALSHILKSDIRRENYSQNAVLMLY